MRLITTCKTPYEIDLDVSDSGQVIQICLTTITDSKRLILMGKSQYWSDTYV